MRFLSALYTTAAFATLSTSALAQVAAKPPAPPAKAPAKVSAASGGTIDPGMTKAQVMERFGKPASERTRGEFTYLFYSNGMEKTVGMSDVVTLQSDKVIDAVLRSSRRTYSGTSSSPKAISAQEARNAKSGTPLKKGGI